MFNYIILFTSAMFSVLANILLKKGSFSLSQVQLSLRGIIDLAFLMLKNIYVMGGLALLGVAFFLWVWLFSKMQLNIVYPISLSSQILLIVIASWFIFREPLSITQIGGIAAIVIGILLIARP